MSHSNSVKESVEAFPDGVMAETILKEKNHGKSGRISSWLG